MINVVNVLVKKVCILKYFRMSALGNTFLVFDARHGDFPGIDFTSVDCDQILVIEASEKADCLMRVFNLDGGEVSACGNGTRCVSKFLKENCHSIEVGGRILHTFNHDDGTVSVDMGEPGKSCYGILLGDEVEIIPHVKGFAIDVGNPHFILMDVPHSAEIGQMIENHPLFAQRINVDFVCVLDSHTILLKTWERGVGLTKACGTGACASAFMMHYLGLMDDRMDVRMDIGGLNIKIINNKIIMRGNAQFDGEGLCLKN
jgi:diaminopimelate epimerase